MKENSGICERRHPDTDTEPRQRGIKSHPLLVPDDLDDERLIGIPHSRYLILVSRLDFGF
jgi:hypothetical protein